MSAPTSDGHLRPAYRASARLFVAKPAWIQVVAELAEKTDYDNFKSEVARHQGKAGAAYEHALHDGGSVMHGLRK